MSFFNRKKQNSMTYDEFKDTKPKFKESWFTLSKLKNIQHKSKKNTVSELIGTTNNGLIVQVSDNPDKERYVVPLKIDALSHELLKFIHYYVSGGFSVEFASDDAYAISWVNFALQKPSDPRFITKGLESSVANYVFWKCHYNIWVSISDVQFKDDELECTVSRTQRFGSEQDCQEITINTKEAPNCQKYPFAIDAWNCLCEVRDFLLEYDKQYNINKEKE